MHMRARDLADAVTSHLTPDVDVKTRKRPLPDAPTIDVSSYHQGVNLYYYAFVLDFARILHSEVNPSAQVERASYIFSF